MGRAFADAAISNCWLGGVEVLGGLVKLGEFGEGFERAVFGVNGFGPGDGFCSGDMSATKGAFVGIIGHVSAGTGKLLGRADIYELTLLFDMGNYFVSEGANSGIIAFRGDIRGVVCVGGFGGERALLIDPFEASAIHDAAIGVSEKVEYPESVASPPVVFVAIKYDV